MACVPPPNTSASYVRGLKAFGNGQSLKPIGEWPRSLSVITLA
jgi:hypothetical protein